MVKLIVLARRPRDWSKAQFTAWWRDHHAALGCQLPGLLAYTHAETLRDYDHPGAPEWDGLAELYFEDLAAVDRAMSSPEWTEAVRDVSGVGGRRIALVLDEVDLLARHARSAAIRAPEAGPDPR